MTLWRVNLLRGVKGTPNPRLTPRILFPSWQADPYVVIKLEERHGVKANGGGIGSGGLARTISNMATSQFSAERTERTKTADDTLAPQWNEDFEFDGCHSLTSVTLQIFDSDLLTSDDPLGPRMLHTYTRGGVSPVNDLCLKFNTQCHDTRRVQYFSIRKTVFYCSSRVFY